MRGVADFAERANAILATEIREQLGWLGNECVKRAREEHDNNWTDRTGNLRSSIGYAYYNEAHKQIQSAFNVVGKGAEGSEQGKRFVDEIAKLFSNTYALIVVAGMDYAGYVEARGRDVLAGARLLAEEQLQQAMNRAVKKAIRNINAQ